MSREITYEPDLVCESCGKRGAFDFMGDALCSKCSAPNGVLFEALRGILDDAEAPGVPLPTPTPAPTEARCQVRICFSGLDEDESGLCGHLLPCPHHSVKAAPTDARWLSPEQRREILVWWSEKSGYAAKSVLIEILAHATCMGNYILDSLTGVMYNCVAVKEP